MVCLVLPVLPPVPRIVAQGYPKTAHKGLVYQNPFVAWFNKNHDLNFADPNSHVADDAIIIGGGLASIDVAKILMIETVRLKMLEKGHHVDVLSLEKKGISTMLSELGMTFEDLGIKGCTLYYRRSLEDMPLSSLPENPTEKEFETAIRVRHKIMDLARKKYMFNFNECIQNLNCKVGLELRRLK